MLVSNWVAGEQMETGPAGVMAIVGEPDETFTVVVAEVTHVLLVAVTVYTVVPVKVVVFVDCEPGLTTDAAGLHDQIIPA